MTRHIGNKSWPAARIARTHTTSAYIYMVVFGSLCVCVHAHTQPRTLTNHIGIYFRKQALHGLASVCVWGDIGIEPTAVVP